MSLSGNTEKINELITKINALPEAGSGGATLETSEVLIYDCQHVYYTGLDDNGAVCTLSSSGTSSGADHTFTAVRNAPIICSLLTVANVQSDGMTLLYINSDHAVLVATAATANAMFAAGGAGGGGGAD